MELDKKWGVGTCEMIAWALWELGCQLRYRQIAKALVPFKDLRCTRVCVCVLGYGILAGVSEYHKEQAGTEVPDAFNSHSTIHGSIHQCGWTIE